MNSSAPSPVQEAVALAEAALALAGNELHPRTRQLIVEVGRGELPIGKAVEQILSHYTAPGAR